MNKWFDIPSKYIDDLCVIVSVAMGVAIFLERLNDPSFQDFSLINWYEKGLN